MRRRRLRPALLLLAPLLAAALAGAAGDAGIEVELISPAPDTPLFGEIDLAVQVQSGEPIAAVEFFLDGQPVGRLTQPPFRVRVDVGEENRTHEVRAVATTASGASASAVRLAPAVKIDEEIDVALRQLFVTVTGEGGRRILQLDRDDFRVLDDGREQQLVTFERGEVPFNAVLLLDTSESMRGARLAAAQAGARSFLERMRELDEASLLLFSDRLLAAQHFTSDKQVLAAGLGEVTAEGGTAVNDHLYLALKMLDGQVGRGAIVLLSDGVDVQSVLRIQEVLWKLRRGQALVYWIRLRDRGKHSSISSAWRDFKANDAEMAGLEQAVVESGGRIEELDDIAGVEPAFRGILAELREQYVLGYYPSNARRDGKWHEVKVKLRGSGKVRTRGGYVDQ